MTRRKAFWTAAVGGAVLTGLTMMARPTPVLAADATATASAVIQGSLSISPKIHGNGSELNFGTISPGASDGWVTVDPAGNGPNRLTSSGVTMVNTGSVSDARFTVEGERNMTYQITLPASVLILSGANSMLVDGFRCCPASQGNGNNATYSTTGDLGGSGRDRIRVGATLHVSSGQAGGVYAAPFQVIVAYN